MNAFADYTRSTAFSLSLSSRMIETLQFFGARVRAQEKADELATRYPWMETAIAFPYFGGHPSAEEAARLIASTERALWRRGLLHVVPVTHGVTGASEPAERWHVTTTTAGALLSDLLVEAGFARTPVEKLVRVPIHPDDRPKVVISGPEPEAKVDRRHALAQPGDEAFFGFYRPSVAA